MKSNRVSLLTERQELLKKILSYPSTATPEDRQQLDDVNRELYGLLPRKAEPVYSYPPLDADERLYFL